MSSPGTEKPTNGNGLLKQRHAKQQLGKRRLGERLVAAAGDGDSAGIKKLVKLGADINYKNSRGETPLSFAAAWNQVDAARSLLLLSANPNTADEMGGTPLMLAAQHGSIELVKLLLKHGANVKAKDKAGNTALAHAHWREGDDGEAVGEVIRKAAGAKRRIVA